ncbi:enoyl-CoA hydratase/isomerase family protein [Natrononativus amylolyticus]|uniref:enoyl-CoA hydratase/isomerase family protein n=1 Tax=Natrononativus amylolyticus TaxID=2963434 RepID=UPI0020CF6B10|nr:enoyl-CoA hydratase-related protein [Natrononativus amylolyticus]
MDTDHLSLEIDDGVGRIVMDRPERHNAMDAAMARDLADALESLSADDDVRCLVLTGTGGAFNTGADLSTLEGDASDAERIGAIATPLHRAVRAIAGAPKPVVTGINGVVAGGGLGLALVGDVVVISEDARLEYAYPKIGLSGDGGATWFLPRLLGYREAQRFALLDEPIGPADAVDLGLATEAVPADEFADRLAELANRLASGPTLAYAEIKTLLRESTTADLEGHLATEKRRITGLAETADYAAGLEGFFEKERAGFEGR